MILLHSIELWKTAVERSFKSKMTKTRARSTKPRSTHDIAAVWPHTQGTILPFPSSLLYVAFVLRNMLQLCSCCFHFHSIDLCLIKSWWACSTAPHPPLFKCADLLNQLLQDFQCKPVAAGVHVSLNGCTKTNIHNKSQRAKYWQHLVSFHQNKRFWCSMMINIAFINCVVQSLIGVV